VKAKQLDDGIVVDTLVSVGATDGIHTHVSINASDSARTPRAPHCHLLFEEHANLALLKDVETTSFAFTFQTSG
jgi:hypothetical protein